MAACSATTERNGSRFSRRVVSLVKNLSTAVSLRGRDCGDVEHEARMTSERGQHIRVRAGGVVVEDNVDDLAGWNRRVDGIEEVDEVRKSVGLYATALGQGRAPRATLQPE